LLIDNVLIYPVNAYLDANPLFTFPEIFGKPPTPTAAGEMKHNNHTQAFIT